MSQEIICTLHTHKMHTDYIQRYIAIHRIHMSFGNLPVATILSPLRTSPLWETCAGVGVGGASVRCSNLSGAKADALGSNITHSY